jgi:hypothetical protein
MTNDRALVSFRDNSLQFIADVCDIGFDDLEELNRKLQGLRNEIDQLEVRACAIAGEQAERMAEPYDQGWLVDFNKGER